MASIVPCTTVEKSAIDTSLFRGFPDEPSLQQQTDTEKIRAFLTSSIGIAVVVLSSTNVILLSLLIFLLLGRRTKPNDNDNQDQGIELGMIHVAEQIFEPQEPQEQQEESDQSENQVQVINDQESDWSD